MAAKLVFCTHRFRINFRHYRLTAAPRSIRRCASIRRTPGVPGHPHSFLSNSLLTAQVYTDGYIRWPCLASPQPLLASQVVSPCSFAEVVSRAEPHPVSSPASTLNSKSSSPASTLNLKFSTPYPKSRVPSPRALASCLEALGMRAWPFRRWRSQVRERVWRCSRCGREVLVA